MQTSIRNIESKDLLDDEYRKAQCIVYTGSTENTIQKIQYQKNSTEIYSTKNTVPKNKDPRQGQI